jgi:hypothetical protein
MVLFCPFIKTTIMMTVIHVTLLLLCAHHLSFLQSLQSLDLGVCSSGICLSHLTNLTALRTDKLFSLESGE